MPWTLVEEAGRCKVERLLCLEACCSEGLLTASRVHGAVSGLNKEVGTVGVMAMYVGETSSSVSAPGTTCESFGRDQRVRRETYHWMMRDVGRVR